LAPRSAARWLARGFTQDQLIFNRSSAARWQPRYGKNEADVAVLVCQKSDLDVLGCPLTGVAVGEELP
jgi:hypothetical protein